MPSGPHEEDAMTEKAMSERYKRQLQSAREQHGKPSDERTAERLHIAGEADRRAAFASLE